MNRSKIEWCDYTWNPVTGCRHGCRYCYARRMTARFSGDVRLNRMARADYTVQDAPDGSGKLYILDAPMLNETGSPLVYPFGFEPTLHRYRMDTLDKLRMGCNIFVCAMSDLFGAWVPDSWIREVIDACMGHPVHNYLFLTKNPMRYGMYGVPEGYGNLWFGTTVTGHTDIGRTVYLPEKCRRFVSVEPLLEDIRPGENGFLFTHTDWIIIGAETGRNKGRVVPQLQWVEDIVHAADREGIPIFMKDSLIPVVGEGNMRREYPDELLDKRLSGKMEEKLYDACASCGEYLKKSGMLALSARQKRGGTSKHIGYMCRACFRKFCQELGIPVPEFTGHEDAGGPGAGKDGADGQ